MFPKPIGSGSESPLPTRPLSEPRRHDRIRERDRTAWYLLMVQDPSVDQLGEWTACRIMHEDKRWLLHSVFGHISSPLVLYKIINNEASCIRTRHQFSHLPRLSRNLTFHQPKLHRNGCWLEKTQRRRGRWRHRWHV
jgi:hypothetical protein